MKNKKEFIPMPIYFQEQSFKEAEKRSKNKLDLISQALEWCSQHINIDKLNRENFLFDFVAEFNKQLLAQKGDIVKAKVGVDKIHFLLDIHISKLKEIQKEFDDIKIDVEINKDDYFCKVEKEKYTIYTKNEDENTKLIKANYLIDAIDKVSGYQKVYPLDLCRGTSNFISYDIRNNKYFLNYNFL
tara:strand:- start:169 stop:726 length:558 start_codon:yes stop_codon:yes gene_type:complete